MIFNTANVAASIKPADEKTLHVSSTVLATASCSLCSFHSSFSLLMNLIEKPAPKVTKTQKYKMESDNYRMCILRTHQKFM